MKNDNRIWFFIRKSLLGGLVILLPISIIAFFFKWIYDAATGLIAPCTGLVLRFFGLPKFAADWVVVAVLIVFCFLIGTLVATSLGSWLWQKLEKRGMERLPGYRLVKEVTMQLFGGSQDSLMRGEVARVWLYGRQVPATVLGLITSRHEDGHLSVFVPTGPNPTSGFIYHVHEDLVERRPDIAVEQMMKTVVACGAGSASLLGFGMQADAAGRTLGLKLSLFDVSNMSDPTERFTRELGHRGSSSDALNDHKSFLFSAAKGNLVAFPASLYDAPPSGAERWSRGARSFSGAVVLNVTARAGFQLRGFVSHEALLPGWAQHDRGSLAVRRVFTIGAALLTLSDAALAVHRLSDLSLVQVLPLFNGSNLPASSYGGYPNVMYDYA